MNLLCMCHQSSATEAEARGEARDVPSASDDSDGTAATVVDTSNCTRRASTNRPECSSAPMSIWRSRARGSTAGSAAIQQPIDLWLVCAAGPMTRAARATPPPTQCRARHAAAALGNPAASTCLPCAVLRPMLEPL